MVVDKGKASWWMGTGRAPQLIDAEEIQHKANFVLEFCISTSIPTSKARVQLRNWGFTPRISLPGPFNTFGPREEVMEAANRDLTTVLAAVEPSEETLSVDYPAPG